jgi:hypothetical protein
MANAAVAWPTWNALNTRLPAAVVWAAGCLTVALASLMIHFIAQVADTKNAGRAAPPVAAAKTNGRKGGVPAAV